MAWAGIGDYKLPDEKLRISDDLDFYGNLFYSRETRKYQLKDLKPIFDYLTDHKDYFFNNEEMINRKITDFNADYTAIPHLVNKKFNFSLIISFSNGDENESWLISKSVDVLNDEIKGLYDILFPTHIDNDSTPQQDKVEESPTH